MWRARARCLSSTPGLTGYTPPRRAGLCGNWRCAWPNCRLLLFKRAQICRRNWRNACRIIRLQRRCWGVWPLTEPIKVEVTARLYCSMRRDACFAQAPRWRLTRSLSMRRMSERAAFTRATVSAACLIRRSGCSCLSILFGGGIVRCQEKAHSLHTRPRSFKLMLHPAPHLIRDIDHERQFAPLDLGRDLVAVMGAGEAALRR